MIQAESLKDIAALLKNKTIESVKLDEEDEMDNYLVFKFTDGTELRVCYDWIYHYELTDPKGNNVHT